MSTHLKNIAMSLIWSFLCVQSYLRLHQENGMHSFPITQSGSYRLPPKNTLLKYYAICICGLMHPYTVAAYERY